MTDQEFEVWLRSDQARRCALVEVDTDTPRLLAVLPYTTLPDDPMPNIRYTARVAGGVAFTESIPMSGQARPSYGDIELDNTDGALDGWLNDVWVNRDVRVYLGDVRWPREDFQLIMTGVCSDLSSRNPRRLNIVLRDKLERLNTAVSETTLGGPTTNADRLIPICLGECHNVTPLPLNAEINETQIFHAGPAESVIEARDNAVPVSKSDSLANGRTTLSATPAGQVTLSVQGDKSGGVYRNTVATLIQHLMLNYGSDRLALADIDTANFNAFDSSNPAPVGVYITDSRRVRDVCTELAASLGAHIAPSRLGLMRLLRIELPPSGTPRAIRQSDYEHGSLSIAGRSTVVAGIRLGYCRNWTPQQDIETGIPAAHRDLYQQEWMTVTASDAGVAAAYRLSTEVEQENTLLLRTVDAQAEANRRLALWKVPRTVYSVKCYAQMLTLNLGDAVTLYGNRYGLDAGKTGMVIGLRSDWVAGRVDVQVIV